MLHWVIPEKIKHKSPPPVWISNSEDKRLEKIDQRAITKEKKHLNIFRYIHYKQNQMEYKASSVLEITNLIDKRVKSLTMCRC